MNWSFLENIPDRFFKVPVDQLFDLLRAPTLFRISGENSNHRPLVISTLLHGNETTGFYAVQALLRKLLAEEKKLPRDLYLFLGNPEAAQYGERYLPHQEDFNRIWNREGVPAQILKVLHDASPLACVDIHNTTGRNPIYSVITQRNESDIALAGMFSEKVVFIGDAQGTFSTAMSSCCPSIAIEAGTNDSTFGMHRTLEYLDLLLHLEEPFQSVNFKVVTSPYEVRARIVVPGQCAFVFGESQGQASSQEAVVDYFFIPDLDALNFKEASKGTLIAHQVNPGAPRLQAFQSDGKDITDEVLEQFHQEVRLRQGGIPAMFSTNVKVVRQDCLGYLMSRTDSI